MIRREDGSPGFTHGVGVDIADLKDTEGALQPEHNILSAILETAGALVVVLEPTGKIVRFNRACERLSGFSCEEARGNYVWDLFLDAGEAETFKILFARIVESQSRTEYESNRLRRDGSRRIIAWSAAVLAAVRRPRQFSSKTEKSFRSDGMGEVASLPQSEREAWPLELLSYSAPVTGRTPH
jgi:PAS domain S-box-containing protein